MRPGNLAALAVLVTCRVLLAGAAPAGDSGVYWSIGQPDNSADEFPSAPAKDLLCEIGKDRPEQNWRQRQDASDRDAPQSRIRFQLDEPPRANPVLAIDCYFGGLAPTFAEVAINGRRGRFRIVPQAAPELDERQSNDMNYSRMPLRVPVDGSQLRPGSNEIAIAFLGDGGSAYFDAVWLLRAGGELPVLAAEVVPTIFFRERAGSLREVTHVVLRHSQRLGPVEVQLEVGGVATVAKDPGDSYDFGERVIELDVPAVRGPQPYTLTVTRGGESSQFRGEFRPEKQWRIFAGLKIHNDIGFTDQQENVHELDLRNTDRALELIARFPFYKFNLETGWLVDNYLRSRDQASARRLLDSVLQDRIGVNAFYLHEMSGICTGEELHRSLYFAQSLKRKYGIPLRSACGTDMPSHTWFLPSLLAGSGIASFANSSNQTRGPLLQYSRLGEDSPFYWEGPDGQRVLTWMTRSYHQLQRLTGSRPDTDQVARVRRALPQFLARFRRPDYPVDAVLLYGLYTDNAEIRDGGAAILERWPQSFAYPQIIAATDADYFDYVSRRFGDKLPVYRGDGGAYWEDGAASTAAETALNRDSQRLLPVAEMASAFATALDPTVRYPLEDFQEAWRNLLFFDEHTWGAYNSINQPDRESVANQWEYKRGYALRAHMAARELLRRGLNRLAQHVSIDGPTLLVFNPDLWPRTDFVEVEIAPTQELFEPATGTRVATEVVRQGTGFRRVRFLAEGVPGLGYRAFGVRLAPPGAAPAALKAAADPWQIESRYYRLVFDRGSGAIAQLWDKELARDLVDGAAPYKLNELLSVSGGETSRLVQLRSNLPPPELTVTGQRQAEVVENTGSRIRIRARAPHVPWIESEIVVNDALKRVEIVNRLKKDEVRAKEAIYFAFPFRAASPAMAYQIQNSWIRPNLDQLPGACRDWFTTQNVVVARGAEAEIAWATPDAPLITLTDINRGAWLRHLEIRNAHVYSYAMNNYWPTNYRASQGGDFTFRYFITSGRALSPESLARFDAETRSPLVPCAYFDTPTVKLQAAQRRLPRDRGSLLEVVAPNAQVTAWKQAEDGNGFILRLRETAGRNGIARVHSPVLSLASARLTNGVEDDAAPLAVRQNGLEIPLRPYGFSTVRLTF